MTTFANQKMRAAREQQNMTLEQLGEVIDVSKVTISRYETGKRRPDLETIGKIAEALQISPLDLIEGDTMTVSERYQLTLKKEVLKEVAADLVGSLTNYVINNNLHEDNPLEILLDRLSVIENDRIIDAPNHDELTKIEGYLDEMSEFIDELLTASKDGVA
ncbi:MAG: helix-turn-helix transcriptional regulator [Lactobacillaceae bacterium]|jgi:transcriptional regulator with XRE-family HTH domain|nr:helix-turn-helix transcriptional regulator [Lactobacillaceae bacterium]